MPVPSQGHYGFPSFPVVDWFCLFVYKYEFCLSLWKIVRSSVILLLPLFTQIHDGSLSWLATCTSIKSGGVKVVWGAQASPFSEMIRSCKYFLHVSKIPTIANKWMSTVVVKNVLILNFIHNIFNLFWHRSCHMYNILVLWKRAKWPQTSFKC